MIRLLLSLLLCLDVSYGIGPFGSFPETCWELDVQYTFMVVIYRGSYLPGDLVLSGGGTLLNAYWVLTTTSHFFPSTPRYIVLAGVHGHRHSDYMRGVLAEKYYISPPSFEAGQWDMAIALLKVKEPIRKSNTISYVPWAKYDDYKNEKVEDVCRQAVVMGFSNISDEFDALNCRQVEVLSELQCNRTYHKLPENTGCFQGFHSECDHYKGGPLMCNGTQYGVFNNPLCTSGDPKHPGVFTKVHMYEKFIRSTVEQHHEEKFTKLENASTSKSNFLNLLIFLSSFVLYLKVL